MQEEKPPETEVVVPEVKIAFPEVKFPTPEIKVIQSDDVQVVSFVHNNFKYEKIFTVIVKDIHFRW